MNEKKSIDDIREQIDSLDIEIQALINKRANFAQQVAQVKRESGETHVYRPEREAKILREVIERNQGPLNDESLAKIFHEIISACLTLQQPVKTAYLGPEGTFTEAAVLKHFGGSVDIEPMTSIDEVFRVVESGSVTYGVVPVENSTEGVVTHTLDRFTESSLKVCGEVSLRINHNLLASFESLDDVTEVVSHQQSLAQCREWLDANLPNVKRTAVGSTAQAAELVKGQKNIAAIASDIASEKYGLNKLATNIEDRPDNTTRFLIIGKQLVPSSGNDKTSIFVSAKDGSGALHNLLKPLADNEQNMLRIQSRPSRSGVWDYVFFIDIDGHCEDRALARALRAIEKEAAMLKVLGSYPKAIL